MAQILDYAKEVITLRRRWSYEELNAAVRRASGDKRGANTVFELARTESEKLDEAEFVDDVTRHLADGRFLLLVVGDGIREGVKRLAEYLQRLAGVQFTFGLVELAMFELPAASTPGGLIVEPRVLARTVEIERAIVRRADPGVAVEEPPTLPTGRTTRRRLTEDGFYVEIGKVDRALPDPLREFFGRVEDLGLDVIAETASMVLRWRREDGKNIYFGILSVNGRLNAGSIVLRAEEYGNPQVGLDYLRSLAAIIPHSKVEPTGNRHKFRVTVSGRPPEFAAPARTLRRLAGRHPADDGRLRPPCSGLTWEVPPQRCPSAPAGKQCSRASGDRIQWVVGAFWSTADPTTTHRRQEEIVAEQFRRANAELVNLMEVQLADLEAQADAAGVPWTPGRRIPR